MSCSPFVKRGVSPAICLTAHQSMAENSWCPSLLVEKPMEAKGICVHDHDRTGLLLPAAATVTNDDHQTIQKTHFPAMQV
jgi:hypothetical protein